MRDENVTFKIETYPTQAKIVATTIRELIFATAKAENSEIIEETLKWGEPSFKATKGTPIRMDWKEKTPDKFYIFFNCQTAMIDTCREIYGTRLSFEGNRAIVLTLSEELPIEILQRCFSLAVKYQLLKQLPFLGALK